MIERVTESPRTVLVVDDSEDTRVMYGAYLRHVGFHVREAATGAAVPACRGARRSGPEAGRARGGAAPRARSGSALAR